MYAARGRVLTSVFVEAMLDAANLCIETGAIAEAHEWKEPITASVCVMQDDTAAKPKVVTACGLRQERLGFWGPDVEIDVPRHGPAGWEAHRTRTAAAT